MPRRATPPEDDFEDEEPKAEGWVEEDSEEIEDLDEEAEPDFAAVVEVEEEEPEEEEEEEAFSEKVYEEGEEEEGEEGEEEALDELEAEELDMLTEDEAAESLPVNEVEELRQLRREAIELELGADGVGDDEFVCTGCFLVKRVTQLADKRRKLCRDCV
ncbi:MAG TPA: DUF4193 family protein [Acidimicrobiia bacterium]|nr:DUF4193 family protein [Acidimicrobiia bacterium]